MHLSATGVVATIVVLSVMVFVHELGHFIVAKLFKVRVEVFSLGFGRRIVGFEHGGTDYRISILPLGGYVKMAGELPTDQTTGSAEEFIEHPRWQRVLIALAGPCANFLLAFALMTVTYMFHYEVNQYMSQPVVLDYVPQTSVAAQAGLAQGDRITEFDGLANPDWEQLAIRLALNPNKNIAAEADHDGTTHPVTLKASDNDVITEGLLPVMTTTPLNVMEVEQDMPAARAGMQRGDQIVAVDGVKVHSLFAFIDYLQDNKGKPVQLSLLRDGTPITLTMTPVVSTDGTGQPAYRVGFRPVPPPVDVRRLGPFAAMHQSASFCVANSTLILEVFKRMVTREMSVKAVAGPVGIWSMTSEAASMPGWTPLITLAAAISLNLGIVNLLPFPILDGGVILFLLIEGLMRRDLNQQFKERVYQVAFVLLLIVVVLVIFNDISKLGVFAHSKS
jgi:regulator of sigma E protease